MLRIAGGKFALCDGLTRRRFLEAGGLSLCGLSLPQLLRAEANAPKPARHKSVIMIFMPGGPSHIDMYDLKPDAPKEVRGEFQPIATRVPGIQICEHLPRIAQSIEKMAIVRSIVGGPDDHACHMCLTGYPRLGPKPGGGRPSIGPIVSRLLGSTTKSVPPAVDLADKMIHPPYNDPGPGFLGVGHATFRPDKQSTSDLVLNGVTADRLSDRQTLLASFDQLKQDADASGMLTGVDVFHQRAFELITSARMRDALDVSREDPRVLASYGPGDPSLVEGFNAAPKMTEHLVTARRLVEAGARCVSVAFGAWDWHNDNFNGHRGRCRCSIAELPHSSMTCTNEASTAMCSLSHGANSVAAHASTRPAVVTIGRPFRRRCWPVAEFAADRSSVRPRGLARRPKIVPCIFAKSLRRFIDISESTLPRPQSQTLPVVPSTLWTANVPSQSWTLRRDHVVV
nr:hypothetical protein [uncultured bacterium]